MDAVPTALEPGSGLPVERAIDLHGTVDSDLSSPSRAPADRAPADQAPADRARADRASPAGRSVIVGVCLLALILMIVFEVSKSLLLPDLTTWQSNWVTIGFSTVASTGVTFWIVARLRYLTTKALAVLDDRQRSDRRAMDAEHLVRELRLTAAAQARFSALVEHSEDVILIMETDGLIRYGSPAARRMSGYPTGSHEPVNAKDNVHPDDLGPALLTLTEILKVPGASALTEMRVRHSGGGWFWVELRATNMVQNPALKGIVVNYRNITERREAEDAAREQAATLRLLAEVATAANTAASVREALARCLRAVCEYTGWAVGHAYLVQDGTARMLVSSGAWHDNEAVRYADLAAVSGATTFVPGRGLPGQVLATGAAIWNVPVTELTAVTGCALAAGLVTGHFLPAYENDEVVSVLEFYSGTDTHVTSELTDLLGQVAAQVGRVVARERAARRLSHEALHDALTGLPNRRLFQDRLEQALRAAVRAHHPVAVLLLDLDWFKTINNSLGHHAGDSILREICTRLKTCTRPGDTVARLGGDEFAILLPRVAGGDDADRLASRILDVLRMPFQVDDSLLAIQGSLGIALSSSGVESAEDLLRNADVAMYRAKATGRGQAIAFTPAMHESARLRLELGGDLQRALDAGEYVVYYQPKVTLATGRVTGTEALVRWRHPVLGLVPPLEFIPIAEETGLIVALGDWVLNQACAQTVAWQAGLPLDRPLSVAVNLSVKQFGAALTGTVSAALARSRLAPDRLTLEITESLLLDDERVVAQLGELRSLGVKLSIDDFGTGYSSLSRLHSCVLDELKIDKSFVDEITSPDSQAPMVVAVIALAHAVGATVVAEGVETRDQLEFLTRHRCDHAQGYLLSRPVPAHELTVLLAAGDRLTV